MAVTSMLSSLPAMETMSISTCTSSRDPMDTWTPMVWTAVNMELLTQMNFGIFGTFTLECIMSTEPRYDFASIQTVQCSITVYLNILICLQEMESVSNAMLDMWVNFGASGDPTPPDTDLVSWSPVTADTHQYLVIDTTMRMEQSQSYNDRMALWDDVYQYPEGNTIPPQPWNINIDMIKKGNGKSKSHLLKPINELGH